MEASPGGGVEFGQAIGYRNVHKLQLGYRQISYRRLTAKLYYLQPGSFVAMIRPSAQSCRRLQSGSQLPSGPDAEFQTSGLAAFVEHAQLMPATGERVVEGSILSALPNRLAIEEPPAPAAAAQGRKIEP